MFTLFLLYGLIVFVLLIGAFFIVYHILRYSLSESLGYFGAIVFGGVFLLLLMINFLSFQSLETESVLPSFDSSSLFEDPTKNLPASNRNAW